MPLSYAEIPKNRNDGTVMVMGIAKGVKSKLEYFSKK
jgi:hypothetical protein